MITALAAIVLAASVGSIDIAIRPDGAVVVSGDGEQSISALEIIINGDIIGYVVTDGLWFTFRPFPYPGPPCNEDLSTGGILILLASGGQPFVPSVEGDIVAWIDFADCGVFVDLPMTLDGCTAAAWDGSVPNTPVPFTLAGATVTHQPDIDNDGTVGVTDYLTVLGSWNTGPGPCDLDCDGNVGIVDFLTLLGAWG